jgi:hypothetical protein
VNEMPAITIDMYPQLSELCWNRNVLTAEESEVLGIYEASWRFVDKDRLSAEELGFINRLVQQYGNGVLNV